MSKEGRRLQRRRWFLALPVLFGVAIIVVYAVWFHPWLAYPDRPVDEIHARWAKVEQWAEPRGDGSLDRLVPTMEQARWHGIDPERLLERAERDWGVGEGLPQVPRSYLVGEYEEVLEDMRAWARSTDEGTPSPDAGMQRPNGDGGRPDMKGPRSLSDSEHATAALNLGRLALATAKPHQADHHLEATLSVAKQLRRDGDLLTAVVGRALWAEAGDWVYEHEVPLAETYERYDPDEGEVFFALARDAVASVRMVEDDLDRVPSLAGYTLWRSPRLLQIDHAPFGLLSVTRERLVLRAFHGDRIHGIYEVREDPVRLQHALQELVRRPRPHSPFLQMTAVDYNRIVEDYRESIEAGGEVWAKVRARDPVTSSAFQEGARTHPEHVLAHDHAWIQFDLGNPHFQGQTRIRLEADGTLVAAFRQHPDFEVYDDRLSSDRLEEVRDILRHNDPRSLKATGRTPEPGEPRIMLRWRVDGDVQEAEHWDGERPELPSLDALFELFLGLASEASDGRIAY